MLDRMMEIVHGQWRIHFVVVLGVHVSREILAERYAELLGGDQLEPYRLLEGLPNATLDADDDLAGLAATAERLDVADLILELPADDALAELRRLNDGRELLAALDVHLAAFGARSRLHELAEPRYAERPEFVIESIRLLLERPRAAAEERDRRARERDRLEEQALARIGSADRPAFEALLARVKAAAPLEEGHTLHIDQRGLQAVREALLGFGSRLVAEGRLDRAADVFLIDRHELRRALSHDHGRGLQALARRRRRELDDAAGRTPELVIGRPAPADAAPDPMFVKFYGTPGEARGDGAHLVGYGASPGHAVGTARIVRSAADLGRVSAGDILVCTTTTPSWTPVFASVAGIVTDTGGDPVPRRRRRARVRAAGRRGCAHGDVAHRGGEPRDPRRRDGGRVDRLILVRHGETSYNARGLMNPDSTLEAPLSADGEAAVQRLARSLGPEAIDLIVTSPRLRARRTAELLAAGRDVEVATLDDLAEIGAGSFEVGPVAAFQEWVLATPPQTPAPGGESVLDATRRYVAAVVAIRAEPCGVMRRRHPQPADADARERRRRRRPAHRPAPAHAAGDPVHPLGRRARRGDRRAPGLARSLGVPPGPGPVRGLAPWGSAATPEARPADAGRCGRA